MRKDDFHYFFYEKSTNTLENKLKNKEITEDNKIRYFFQICSALSYFRKVGFYHRDIKPSNIFLFYDDIKIRYFGKAKNID